MCSMNDATSKALELVTAAARPRMSIRKAGNIVLPQLLAAMPELSAEQAVQAFQEAARLFAVRKMQSA